ncbi:hypothetical protein Zmor_011757 [Zophobas morio]|jgi:hypothetical protein|uniref:Uncharacterized protein n=1 Tax=Zophobas morio TaxID=2755281 RepID=A0AA38M0C7_9CUCU|nr:hypothetical protein Zmor_011757 [Zophobas morio]
MAEKAIKLWKKDYIKESIKGVWNGLVVKEYIHCYNRPPNVLGVCPFYMMFKVAISCEGQLNEFDPMYKPELDNSTKNDLVGIEPDEVTTSGSIKRVKRQQLEKKMKIFYDRRTRVEEELRWPYM